MTESSEKPGSKEKPIELPNWPLDIGINDYARRARETALYTAIGEEDARYLVYPALKLTGEAGEVAEQIGKIYRDDGGMIEEGRRQKIIIELGDVAWYWANLCFELGIDPSVVLKLNLMKLKGRAERGKIQGDGSER